MAIHSAGGVNAYQNQLKLMQGSSDSGDSGAAGGANTGGSFEDLLGHALKGAINTQRGAEALQVNAMTGKVELSDLVTAVANAQLSLSTVVAVRDRVISAYQDIIKMSI